MKKRIYFILLEIVFASSLFANTNLQNANKESALFQHLDLSVSIGSTGLGFDLATAIHPNIGIRGGFRYMPKISPRLHFGIEDNANGTGGVSEEGIFDKAAEKVKELTGCSIDKQIDMIGVPTFYNANLLVEIMPLPNKHWHLGTGFYWGPKRIAKTHNATEDAPSLLMVNIYNNIYHKVDEGEAIIGEDMYLPPDYEEKILEQGIMGIHLGEKADGTSYMMVPDENAMVKADVLVNSFKPYLGLGYNGNFLKKDSPFYLSFDAGLMFWGGSPRIIAHDGTDISRDIQHIGGKIGKYIDAITAFKAFPVVEFRISYRL